MDPRDDDIDFGFFDDEPATTEAAAARVRMPRRAGPRRPAGPGRGVTPLLRLLGAIGIVVAVLVFFGLLIQSCASTSKHDAYAAYMDKVATIARSSAGDGQQVATALTTPNAKVSTLVTKLDGVAQQEQQNAAAAERLSPPGRLRDENTRFVEALQLRVNGTQGLADTFQATAKSKASTDASLLLQQAKRLSASDVVYDDLFVGPTKTVMQQQGVVGVRPPSSHYLASDDQLTQSYWGLALNRLRGSTTTGGSTSAGGLHGTNVVSTKALPGGPTLSESSLNTVTASADLAFSVTVHNGGDSQEVHIAVTLTIEKTKGSIVKNKTIDVINPGKDVTLTFPIVEQPPFAQKTQLKVDVASVPHEANVTNNSATYPVIFSLG
ncbi:MAG: CARDB domain-containing protein [Gaiellaceae bacterium]